jgi:hypothetical protein
MMVFDYIFYRITTYYRNKYAEWFPQSRGIVVVTLLQSVMIIDLWSLWGLYKRFEFRDHLKLIFGLVFFVLLVLAFLRYTRASKYQEFRDRWDAENPRIRKRRTWLISLFALVVFGAPFILGLINHL